MDWFHFRLTLVIGLLLAGFGNRCLGDDNKPANANKQRRFGRGSRYGEVLLVRRDGTTIEAEVWGTQGLSDCPAASWEALDPRVIRSETGALAVVLNGPRYWLPNLTMGSLAAKERKQFGELEMRRLATLEIRPPLNSDPYQERTVRRKTNFVFQKGEEIYELKSPNGAVYVMQSMSQIVDRDLKIAELSTLASGLTLPEGWTYEARTLDDNLVLTAKGKAIVLQDDLRNTYQRR